MKSKSTFIARAVRTVFVAGVSMAAVLPISASAAVVFQSVADLTDTSKIANYGLCSSCHGRLRAFDQFTLASAESIKGFSVSLFAGGYAFVNFSVWTVGGDGLAGTQLFSQDFSVGSLTATPLLGTIAPSVIASSMDVSGLNLAAGEYYVSFFNPHNLNINGYNGGGNKLYQQEGSFNFTPNGSLGFTLSGEGSTVPEPASLALVGLAVLCAGAVTRRRSS